MKNIIRKIIKESVGNTVTVNYELDSDETNPSLIYKIKNRTRNYVNQINTEVKIIDKDTEEPKKGRYSDPLFSGGEKLLSVTFEPKHSSGPERNKDIDITKFIISKIIGGKSEEMISQKHYDSDVINNPHNLEFNRIVRALYNYLNTKVKEYPTDSGDEIQVGFTKSLRDNTRYKQNHLGDKVIRGDETQPYIEVEQFDSKADVRINTGNVDVDRIIYDDLMNRIGKISEIYVDENGGRPGKRIPQTRGKYRLGTGTFSIRPKTGGSLRLESDFDWVNDVPARLELDVLLKRKLTGLNIKEVTDEYVDIRYMFIVTPEDFRTEHIIRLNFNDFMDNEIIIGQTYSCNTFINGEIECGELSRPVSIKGPLGKVINVLQKLTNSMIGTPHIEYN